MDVSWLIIINGCPIGCPAIHVSASKSEIQNNTWLMGRNIMFHCFDVWRRGIVVRIAIDRTRTHILPSLLGIYCRITQSNGKYHSGLI